ncbi:sensor histidine kinase [Ideonella livida]|uniref:histidine kinase n=1 Tax=Ideonella livida TaxID=2707176 RepID=A0A7C9TLR0_9BURK|nr:sensor histidine kinase [Ideonella livida]NDY92802.1 hypothetical protein [Ideonella livida]
MSPAWAQEAAACQLGPAQVATGLPAQTLRGCTRSSPAPAGSPAWQGTATVPHWLAPLQAAHHDVIRLHWAGPEPVALLLDLGVPDAMHLSMAHTAAGRDAPLAQVHLGPDSQVADRPLPAPRLSLPVTLAPGLNEIALTYRVHAGGRLQPALEPPARWQVRQARFDWRNGLIVGAMLVLIDVVLVLLRVARERSYLYFVLLVSVHAFLLGVFGGYGLAFWWPQSPGLNQLVPVVGAALALGLHALFSLSFLRLRVRAPGLARLHGLVVGLAGLALAGVLATGLHPLWYATLLLCAAIYVPLSLGAAAHAAWQRLPGARLYLLGELLLVLFSFVLFGLSVLGHNPWPDQPMFMYPKIGLLAETAFFSLALILRVRRFQREQAELRERRLVDAQALWQAESARQEADERARQQLLRLASAGHDLHQPLASLRMAIDALHAQLGTGTPAGGGAPPALAEHLTRSLDYAQTLVRDILAQSRQDHQHLAADTVSLGHLIGQVVQEHQAGALAKGLRLRAVDTSAEVAGSALILHRLLHNLVGNAVRYTLRGHILVGVRHRAGGALELQVLDQGPGLEAHQLQTLQAPFQQGPQASEQGHGLGLFIVRSLCAQAGYQLVVRSRPGHGSCFGVHLPAAVASRSDSA